MTTSKPPSPGYLVWRLSMKWRAMVDAAVADFGLTHAKYSVLASLRGITRTGHVPSQKELADFTGLEPIYISKLVRVLERDELIRRTPNAADSRAIRLTMTKKGIQTIDRAVVVVQAMQEQLTLPLGGTSSTRTRVLMHELEILLEACESS
jgi:DNA-binding MarR family transcriptional regulator